MNQCILFWDAIFTWLPPAALLALQGIFAAAGMDLLLTAALAVTNKLTAPFQWKLLPKTIVTNVLPAAMAVLVGAAVIRVHPDLEAEFLTAAAILTAWLVRDWRRKWKVLLGFDLPVDPNQPQAVNLVLGYPGPNPEPEDPKPTAQA